MTIWIHRSEEALMDMRKKVATAPGANFLRINDDPSTNSRLAHHHHHSRPSSKMVFPALYFPVSGVLLRLSVKGIALTFFLTRSTSC